MVHLRTTVSVDGRLTVLVLSLLLLMVRVCLALKFLRTHLEIERNVIIQSGQTQSRRRIGQRADAQIKEIEFCFNYGEIPWNKLSLFTHSLCYSRSFGCPPMPLHNHN